MLRKPFYKVAAGRSRDQQLLSIADVSRWLGLSFETLRSWDRNGRLPAIRLGPSHRRFYEAAVIRRFLSQSSRSTKNSETARS